MRVTISALVKQIETYMKYPESIAVFCGASNHVAETHLEIGQELGKEFADHNIRLVYGGGDCGVMGAIANSVMDHGGAVTGVFPKTLADLEDEHEGLTESIVVDTMHQRKEIMYKRSKAFIILPGGFGTMDEMFEIITWKQLRLHNKPIIVFNHNGYWNHLIALMDNIIAKNFAKKEVSTFYQVVDDMPSLMEAIEVSDYSDDRAELL